MGLTNSQYNKLILEYDARRLRAEKLRDDRYREVCDKIPEFAALEENSSSAMADMIRRSINSDRQTAPVISREYISDIKSRKAELLKAHGYPADYLDIKYTCPDCRDTGYTGGHKCHCFIEASINLVFDQGGLRDILTRECFDNFSLEFYPDGEKDSSTGKNSRENAEYALSYARSYCEGFNTGHSGENLFIFGQTGTGKTFLTHCIAGELIRHGHSAIYLTASALFDIIADSRFRRDQAADRAGSYSPDDILGSDLLVIDDLGSENPNNFTVSALFNLLNDRASRSKSVVISSNLDLAKIRDIYSERIFSRIAGGYKLLKLYTDRDIRLKRKI